MTKVAGASLDAQLCFAVYSASRALTRAYAPLLEPLGLTYPQYLVMLVLWEEDRLSVRQLGRRLGLDSGTLTPLLTRLERSKLVTRHRGGGGDERIVRIHLTAAGRALETKARQVPLAIACRAGFDFTDEAAIERIVRLREELRAMVAQLDAVTR